MLDVGNKNRKRRFEKDVGDEDYRGREVTRVMSARELRDGNAFYLERKTRVGQKAWGVASPGGVTETA